MGTYEFHWRKSWGGNSSPCLVNYTCFIVVQDNITFVWVVFHGVSYYREDSWASFIHLESKGSCLKSAIGTVLLQFLW